MSVLSAQVDELRAMAVSVGLAMPQAATLMMDAADTIWELRGSVHRERTEADMLRGLVRELWAQAEQNLVCDENCPYGATCNWMDSDVVCVFKRRMRELGVEP